MPLVDVVPSFAIAVKSHKIIKNDTKDLKITYLKENSQSSVGDITHCMLKCPNDRVKDQFELSRRNIQKCFKAMHIDRLQKFVKVCTMLRIVLKVLINHVQCTLKDGIKDFRYFRCNNALQLIDNRCHCT